MISRRDFLKQSLAVVSLGIGVPSVFADAALAARSDNSAGKGRTLVVVQLAGGVDGLNTVVPYADPLYRDNRPALGVAEDQLLPLDDKLAFHPALTGLKGLFDAGKLAVVQGAGYPQPTFSHFKAMDIWQTAHPEGKETEGWLGAYFDSLTDGGGHPLAGLSVGRSLPTAFESQKSTIPAVDTLESFALQAPKAVAARRETALVKLYDEYQPQESGFSALLDTTLDTALQSSRDLTAASQAYKPAAAYPQSSLASGLQLLAELIDSGEASPLRVGHVSLGGFDTHTQQDQRLEPLLKETSDALAAFWQDIEAHGHGDEVVVMTWSEFGRRVKENGQKGTDHGSAGPMFLIGNAIKGGIHGETPDLRNLDNGNLRFTVDFRSVYSAVLESWLEASSRDILGQSFDKLDLFAV